MSFDQRRRIHILNGACLVASTLGSIFMVANLALRHYPLALSTSMGVAIAVGSLFLTHSGRRNAASILLIGGMTAYFGISGFLFRNSLDYSLLLCVGATLLIMDSLFWRRVMATVAGTLFVAIQTYHFAHPGPSAITAPHFAINLVICVVSLYGYHALFRSLQDQALGVIVEKNDQLEQQRLLLEAEHAKLMDRSAQLDAANAAKEKLFSIVGHDLRGPVGNVRQALDLLHDGTLSPEEFRELLHDLRGGVDHLHASLENLMEWAAAQMDSLEPRFGSALLRRTASEAAGLLAGIARDKEIAVENALPDEATVRADPHQLQAIFRNLLANALKFTPTGGRVSLSACEENGAWRITVRDSGVGMAPERAALLFSGERHSTRGTANEKGLGLGLQICGDFVRSHGGTIEAESEPGMGSSFHVTLPKA
jgi:signal transduction histidine kinase